LKEAGFEPSETYLQSFNLDDVKYWIKEAPKFGKQAVYLDDRVYEKADFVASVENMKELRDAGVNIIAPPLFALVDLDENNELVASNYAKLAKGADLDIIA
ncbi:glycerophosphodiester phosphodiesterase, partial [Vibrio sp. 10N.222.54.F6]